MLRRLFKKNDINSSASQEAACVFVFNQHSWSILRLSQISQKGVEVLNGFAIVNTRLGRNFFQKRKPLWLDTPHPQLKVGFERAGCALHYRKLGMKQWAVQTPGQMFHLP